MGEFNQLIGDKIPLAVGDKTYWLARLTDKIRAEYERYLESSALATVQKSKESLPRDDYLDLLLALNVKISTGYFTYGQQAFQDSLRTLEGLTQLFWLLLKPHQPNITLAAVQTLAVESGKEIAESIQRALDDGNTSKKKPMENPIPIGTENCTQP